VTTGWLSMITPVPSTNPQSGPARRRPALDLRYRVINTPITEPQRQSARRARRSDTPQASEGTFAARIRHERVTAGSGGHPLRVRVALPNRARTLTVRVSAASRAWATSSPASSAPNRARQRESPRAATARPSRSLDAEGHVAGGSFARTRSGRDSLKTGAKC
jgi:hypothetical protein